MKDYYQILGVSKESNIEEIKRSYRVKAKKYHPDVYNNSEAKMLFQEINEAYHVLIDRDKRRYYDIKSHYDISQYKKYGKNYENRYKRNDESYSYYAEYTKKRPVSSEEKIFSKKLNLFTDTFFFYVMLFIGIVTIIFGSIDLFFTEWDGLKSLTGFLFGVSFTSILIYGWYLRSRTDKKNIRTGYF